MNIGIARLDSAYGVIQSMLQDELMASVNYPDSPILKKRIEAISETKEILKTIIDKRRAKDLRGV